MSFRFGPLRFVVAFGLLACDSSAPSLRVDIPGAHFLSFRCVAEGPDGLVGLPLEGCGCSERAEGTVRLMGRVECDCRQINADGAEERVDFVQVDPATCTDGTCTPVISETTGDWAPADAAAARTSPPQAVACEPRRNGRIRGYVGSPERGEVAVIDITPPGSNAEGGRILDVDPTIPGVTAVFVDDLVSDVESHPDGDFIFTVNSSAGTLSVVTAEDQLGPAFQVDLGGPLLEAVVWPPIHRVRPNLGVATAFVSQPQAGAVLELDLVALGAQDAAGTVKGRFELTGPGPGIEAPGHLAVSPDGQHLLVTHARRPWITVFDRVGGAPRIIDLAPRHPCADGFLERVLATEDDVTCTDAFDNDGNGLTDAADPACQGSARTEAVDPRCPKQSECNDGADNDGDGDTDQADSDCDPRACVGDDCPPLAARIDWEGPIPACANGQDDDGDGRIDRADPGCQTEGDNNEADPLERDDLCDDSTDNDGDGLIDAEDPGCTDVDAAKRYRFEAQPQCADEIDNDFDGLTDFGQDPDCYGASDDSEAAGAAAVGPTAIEVVGVPTADGLRQFAYVVDSTGNLLTIDLNDPALPVGRVALGRVTPLALAARQIGQSASLLMVGNDTALRSIEVSAPTPLRTEDGLPIFAQFDQSRSSDEVQRFKAFYVVQDGVAWAVEGVLDALVGVEFGAPGDLPVTDFLNEVVPFRLADDVADRTPLVVADASTPGEDRGRFDPMLFADLSVRTLLQAEANVFLRAHQRTSRVLGAPRFFVNNSPTSADPRRHPVFCQLAQPDPEAEGGVSTPEGCIPVGYDAAGQLEARTEADARTRFRVDLFEGIQVIENDPTRVVGGTYTLAFQAELPDTASRTGQFASRESDERWTLVDYATDFCSRGVEVGDVVLVDVFVPSVEAANEPECRALQAENRPGDPLNQREPLRYRIAEVAARKLVLERDTTSTFAAQLPRDDRSTAPLYYDAPPAPLEKCAAQLIAYRIRAGQDVWTLTGSNSGYRHPWVSQDGLCVQSESRVQAGRLGRVSLEEPFENEWFRFHLGALRPTITDGRLPHMADARFEFDVAAGVANSRLPEFAIIPGSLRWLPNDDHAYVVDSAVETVIEAAGLDVFLQSMQRVRQFE